MLVGRPTGRSSASKDEGRLMDLSALCNQEVSTERTDTDGDLRISLSFQFGDSPINLRFNQISLAALVHF